MMNDFWFSFIAVVFIAVASFFGGVVGGEINEGYDLYDRIINPVAAGVDGTDSLTVEEMSAQCNHLERIDKRLQCVNTRVQMVYTYKVRPDDEIISFDTLMTEGGDCGNWAKLWEFIAEQYEYDIEPIRVGINETTAHRFSIISNEQGYCTVDQTKVKCFMYG